MASMTSLQDMTLKQLSETPHSDMDAAQKEKMIQLCKNAFDQYEKCNEKGKADREFSLISKFLKQRLDSTFGPNWFVLVGQSYAAQFTCESKSYWHYYHRKSYITCYKTQGSS
mmetsp:Transcript_16363/g.20242  ORF Transcript_16363/g.20242 Transcript_16363/m.20242 type:complete len:113 (-) Transcript_16363:976-1314(-)